MENTDIGWTHNTFNAWIGCNKVSPGCKNCYAEQGQDKRYGRAKWGPNGTRSVTSYQNWKKVLKWDRDAYRAGVKQLVFCQSLSDTFEDFSGPVINSKKETLYWHEWANHHEVDGMPIFDNIQPRADDYELTLNDVRAELFKLIDRTPNLIWQLLTKRPENMVNMVPDHWKHEGWPRNVWAGASAENQEQAEIRTRELLKVPAYLRFLSCEPLLSNIEFGTLLGKNFCGKCNKWNSVWTNDGHYACCSHCLTPDHYPNNSYRGINWIIAGGESGNKARAMQKAWAMSIQLQCKIANVPFFFKQWGEHDENIQAVGKKKSGELLNGIEYKQFPAYK